MDKVNNKRTDMAVEFVPKATTKKTKSGLRRTDLEVDDALAKKLNKPAGIYITVESDAIKENRRHEFDFIAKELSDAIGGLIKNNSCLVVGLGNPNMTADALGSLVANRLMITRHLSTDKDMPCISCICPNVLGVTGIESFDVIKGVVDRVNPDSVIVVDSLAGASTSRIASAFQVSSAGITPGSGVCNHRIRLDKESLGKKVISVGVPLVVYASTIIEDALNNKTKDYDYDIGSMIVTPKDIDLYVEDCALIVARAINYCFFGEGFVVQ